MNSYEIGEFKLQLIKTLIDNNEIVELLDPNGLVEYPDDLIYTQVFPFNRVPETEQETKTYITIAVNAVSVPQRNDLTRKMSIVVRVYSHTGEMRVAGQNCDRIDLLGARIDKLFNESMDYGIGYMKLDYNTEHVLDPKHFYRELVFTTDSLNSKRDGAKQWT